MLTRVSKQRNNSIKIECVEQPDGLSVYDDLANFFHVVSSRAGHART